MKDDLISRQQAIDGKISIQRANGVEIYSDEAVPVEYLKRLPTIQPEPTDEQVAEYCKRRCLHIVTDDFFHTVQPEPKEGEWVDGRCNKCGGQAPFWVMATTYYESDFCPHCGAKMQGERQK